MSAADLIQVLPARILEVGYPGSGKTGALACLANVGFKLRVIAFDKLGNMAPLLRYSDPEALERIDIIPVEDKLRNGANGIEWVGKPSAYSDAWDALGEWKNVNPRTGEAYSLGHPKDWGPDTIVILDSLTAMGEAARRRALAMSNRTYRNSRDTDWGVARPTHWRSRCTMSA